MVVELHLMTEKKTEPMLPKIQKLLEEHAAVFASPTTLPPWRACDPHIPLVEGARPVKIRPYQHSPELKDKTEKQIAEMLAAGVISPSTSAFSSPIIMVRKKDLTWRSCVDYMNLNMLTVKSKYPLPVIEELLDELSGASWFLKLDLRAGYHQIRLAPGEE
jgi:hypothetical protein